MDKTETYIKMCEKAKKMQDIFLKKLVTRAWEYNHVAVIWSRKDIGGLAGVLLTMEPVYGISWEDGKYLVYNGKIHGKHCKTLLSEKDPKAKVIWLPLQAQLQKMIDEKSPHKLAFRFDGFCNPMKRISMKKAHWEENSGGLDLVPDPKVMNQPELDYPKQFTSMEQLWLAFVMKEKYNKIWDGDKWAEKL